MRILSSADMNKRRANHLLGELYVWIGLIFIILGFIFLLVESSHAATWGNVRRQKPHITSSAPLGIEYIPFNSLVMTASNIPSPVLIFEDSNAGASYECWRAFDKVYGSRWQSAAGAYPHWVVYDSGAGSSNVVATLTVRGYGAGYGPKDLELLGSNDGSGYDLLGSWSIPDNPAWQIFTNTTLVYYRYYKLNVTNGYYSVPLVQEYTLSSSDWENPAMTASNIPAGYIVSVDSTDGGAYPGWKAFDKNFSTAEQWNSAVNTNQHWIKLDLGSNRVVNGFILSSYPSYGMNGFVFSGSLDDSAWVDLQTGSASNNAAQGNQQYFTNNNLVAYRYYRLLSTSQYGDRVAITELILHHYK